MTFETQKKATKLAINRVSNALFVAAYSIPTVVLAQPSALLLFGGESFSPD
jgi:hypothetical protein